MNTNLYIPAFVISTSVISDALSFFTYQSNIRPITQLFQERAYDNQNGADQRFLDHVRLADNNEFGFEDEEYNRYQAALLQRASREPGNVQWEQDRKDIACKIALIASSLVIVPKSKAFGLLITMHAVISLGLSLYKSYLDRVDNTPESHRLSTRVQLASGLMHTATHAMIAALFLAICITTHNQRPFCMEDLWKDLPEDLCGSIAIAGTLTHMCRNWRDLQSCRNYNRLSHLRGIYQNLGEHGRIFPIDVVRHWQAGRIYARDISVFIPPPQ